MKKNLLAWHTVFALFIVLLNSQSINAQTTCTSSVDKIWPTTMRSINFGAVNKYIKVKKKHVTNIEAEHFQFARDEKIRCMEQ